MSTTDFNNVCVVSTDIKISSIISLCILLSAFSQSTNKCVSKLYYLHFSINNFRQNVGSVQKRSIQNPFCVSAVNCYEQLSFHIKDFRVYLSAAVNNTNSSVIFGSLLSPSFNIWITTAFGIQFFVYTRLKNFSNLILNSLSMYL